MQQALFSQKVFFQTQTQAQATRVMPGRNAGLENHASNDECFDEEKSRLHSVLCVLADVLWGGILLSGMFVLPHIIARIFS